MFDTDQALPLALTGVVVLVGLASCLAWIPAGRRDPAGPAARLFMTAGVAMFILDLGGLGSVLGLCLAALGALVAWEGQPEPELPRPPRDGIIIAAVVTGLATVATFEGWGPLGRMPEEARAIATLVVSACGGLATLAVADRARVHLRDSIRRRFGVPSVPE